MPSSAVVYFLVFGTLPPDGHPARAEGLVTAFRLKFSPHLVDDLRALWGRHADEITAATPEGREPWAVRVLRDPAIVDDDENDTNNEEEVL